MKKDKHKMKRNIKVAKIFGWLFLSIPVFYILSGLFSGFKDTTGAVVPASEVIFAFIVVFVIFGIPGLVCLKSAKLERKRLERLEKQEEIAASYEPTFTAHIPERESAPAEEKEAPAPARPAKPVSMAFKCPNCGGINTLSTDAVGECEYCGSAISVPQD